MIHSVVTVICRNFRSSSNNSEWEVLDDSKLSKFMLHRNPRFSDSFYANGNCEENVGYVSINLFSAVEPAEYGFWYDKEVCCLVSVVDVAGKKRFTQSVIFVIDFINPPDLEEDYFLGLERYLKRETLLKDPAELLPGDCLTVCVEVDLTRALSYHRSIYDLYKSDRPFTFDKVNRPWISLDTDFGRELYRVSEVFRYASDLHVMEAMIRQVPIKSEEMLGFYEIFMIFSGSEEMNFRTIADIWELYRVADKYDIKSVIETGRQFFKAVLQCAENPKFRKYKEQCVSMILELADRYRDNDIKDAVEIYLKSKEDFGTNHYILEQHLKKKLYTEWKFEMTVEGSSRPLFFTMKRRVVEPEFQFYQ